jgi:hypothetical protein
VLYMNYITAASPTTTPLTASQLGTVITSTTFQAATSNVSSPVSNGDVSLLVLQPNLGLAQNTTAFTTPSSGSVDCPVVQFAVLVGDLPGPPTLLPPGIMEISLYGRAAANNDVDMVAVRFYLLGHTAGGAYTDLVNISSDLSYFYDFTSFTKLTCSMYIGNPVDISAYESLHWVIAARNRNNTSRSAVLYFQSPNSYSHIHTTFSVAASVPSAFGSAYVSGTSSAFAGQPLGFSPPTFLGSGAIASAGGAYPGVYEISAPGVYLVLFQVFVTASSQALTTFHVYTTPTLTTGFPDATALTGSATCADTAAGVSGTAVNGSFTALIPTAPVFLFVGPSADVSFNLGAGVADASISILRLL